MLVNGEPTLLLPVTKESLLLRKGTQVGKLEEVSFISEQDLVWSTPQHAATIRMVSDNNVGAEEEKATRLTCCWGWLF